MSVTADPAGAGAGDGDRSRGGWSFWNMQRNRGLSAASTSTNWVLSATTKNEGYSIWTSAGGEWRPRPTDAHAPAYYHDLAELYLEAARRLPIADIPYLADCISISGLAVGLADPVTNIVLTTINAFAKRPSYVRPLKPDDALEKISKKTTFVVGARDSRTGLIKFLLCYFRNLTQDQAEKCLDVAGHHLPLAVRLVEVGRWGSESEVVPLLQPDAARTRTALRQAAKCSNTDGLVRLMTWRYPRRLLDPVLDDLRGGKQLTADCIYKICDLLRCSWPPEPTPAPTPGVYRDNSGNVTTITKIRKDVFATTTVSKDLVATTTITSTCPSNGDCARDDGVHLSTELGTEISSGVNSTTAESAPRENPDFLPLLKMSLLDTVHGFYIDALGILPSQALRDRHLLRAVLTAGHCYGPWDPVSNIILNSIWYDAVFPLSDDVANQIGAADILDARSMTRVESCSLDGLVAFVRYTYSISEQEAVVLLCQHRFNLSYMLQGPKKIFFNLASAVLVAKHPQPAAFGDFLNSLTPAKLVRLRSLVSDRGLGYVLSGDTLVRLKKMLTNGITCVAAAAVQSMAPDLPQSALETLSARRETFKSQQDYVRTKLESLLLDYGRNKGHLYRLGIVCGVTTARYHLYSTCYHVNFLASTDVPNDSTRPWALFFAEFWSIVDLRVEESTNVPFCCHVRDSFNAYSIRCIICDRTSCKIAHPSCDENVYFTGGSAQYGFPVHYKWEADLGGMLESDFIYFDRESDDQLAKILSEASCSSSSPKKTRQEFTWSQRNTRARTDAGFGVAPVPF
ncbi:uncharacterized protein [Aegilops tauschii subsp. strangulata]|nr:uncharacterized protein LOC109779547 isoform X1 [Aegilops tauschii subsp. strangulata]